MHELSIALSIVDGVLEELERRPGCQVEAVHLRVGRLAGVDKQALAFSYGVASEGTPLVHSRLVIEEVAVAIMCPQCRTERAAEAFPVLKCAFCGSPGERVTHGEELEITSLELAA